MDTKQHEAAASMLLAALTLAVAGIGAATSVAAWPSPWDQFPLTELEDMYWECDARATRGMLSAGHAIHCASAGDALKRRKFGGDWNRMLAWWHEHKAHEHARRNGEVPASILEDTSLQTP